MYADLKGSINKLKLREKQSVYSVYEGVVNSIQSNSENIIVEIKKTQSPELKLNPKDKREEYVEEIIIKDDGDGFNPENFNSFNKINSTYKLKYGGKGVGRLSWLVFFEKVVVKSTYKAEDKYMYREFTFDLNNDVEVIEEKVIKDENFKNISTEITLKNMFPQYRKKFPDTAKKLGDKILYHCLGYLIEKTTEIIVKDENSEYRCKEEYDNRLAKIAKQNKMKIKGEIFEITHILLPKEEISKHEIVFTADKREVKRKAINNKLFSSPFEIEGKEKNIIIYVKSSYLDSSVTEDRTNFIFPDKENTLFISEAEIVEGVVDKISEIYEKEIEKILKKNEIKINSFLIENPYYKTFFKEFKEMYLKEMNEKTNDDEIEEKFETLVRKQRKDIKQNIKKIDLEKEEWQKKFEIMLRDIDKLNQMELAKYVTHRKVIINFLEKILRRKEENEKYYYESELHNLIFPMRKTGDVINYDEHNLWLLDDRLAYYKFISSDISFDKLKSTSNKERMDLAIFDTPIAFSDKDIEEIHSNVIIIEFKRPGRDDLTSSILEDQIYKYIEELQESKIKSSTGTRIEVSKNSIFNIYIICEITSRLKNQLKRGNYKLMLDEQGYYMYNENYKAFIQILSLNKVLRDAKLRNKIFFKKLGI